MFIFLIIELALYDFITLSVGVKSLSDRVSDWELYFSIVIEWGLTAHKNSGTSLKCSFWAARYDIHASSEINTIAAGKFSV
ncbi:MAG: hypothetical protein RR137_01210 [Odoribacter sp.]